MGYQEIITAYKKKSLDTTSLKEKLEIAKPLKGREKYRVLDMIPKRFALTNEINNLLVTPENYEKLDEFEKGIQEVLNEEFSIIVQSIKKAKAWKFMKLVPSEYTLEKFQQLRSDDKFKIIYDLNKKYLNFLEYQKIADIRDCLRNKSDLDEETIEKLKFLTQMFEGFTNERIRSEFFCFDKDFLMSLIKFRKSKSLRLEDFMSTQKKSIQLDYQKLSKLEFFTNEDFRDISENLVLTSKALKTSVLNIIEAYAEMSETESEILYLEDEINDLKKIEEKALKMKTVRESFEKEKEKQGKIEFAKKLAEEKKKRIIEQKKKQKEEADRKRLEAEKVERARIIKKDEGSNGKMEQNIDEIRKTPSVKEQVKPLIFYWLEREDITLTRRVTSKKLTAFFDKLKQIEAETGTRISLFIITNAGKEVALKRMIELQKKAKVQGLPRIVEGVLGGYSTFRIDSDGNITDIALMSDLNRAKIINLLENSRRYNLPRELIVNDEKSYLRYQFTDKKDKSINENYLKRYVMTILEDERVSRQPIKLLPFMEGKYAGIDAVLESQLKGISQLPDYYRSKYHISPGKTLNVRINDIDSFIGKEEIIEQSTLEEK